jgi:hypothetical protein
MNDAFKKMPLGIEEIREETVYKIRDALARLPSPDGSGICIGSLRGMSRELLYDIYDTPYDDCGNEQCRVAREIFKYLSEFFDADVKNEIKEAQKKIETAAELNNKLLSQNVELLAEISELKKEVADKTAALRVAGGLPKDLANLSPEERRKTLYESIRGNT